MIVIVNIACLLLLYAPFTFVGAAVVRSKPQFIIAFLVAILWSFVSSYAITSLIYAFTLPNRSRNIAQEPQTWVPRCSEAGGQWQWAVARDALVWITQNILVIVSKSSLLAFFLYMNEVLKADNQAIDASQYRIVALSACIALGYSAASSVLSGGLLLDAQLKVTSEAHAMKFSSYAATPVAYDLHVCPQLPVVVHRSFESFLFSLSTLAWFIVHGLTVAALVDKGIRSALRDIFQHSEGLNRRRADGTPCDIEERLCDNRRKMEISVDANKGPVYEREESCVSRVLRHSPSPSAKHSSSASTESREDREAGEGEEPAVGYMTESMRFFNNEDYLDLELQKPSSCSSAVVVDETKLKRLDEVFGPGNAAPRTAEYTYTYHHFRTAFFLSCIVALLQLVFTGLTLRLRQGNRNRGSYDCAALAVVPNQGCAMSLPLQLVITVFSIIIALWMTRMEYGV